jgi:hypothetical protein
VSRSPGELIAGVAALTACRIMSTVANGRFLSTKQLRAFWTLLDPSVHYSHFVRTHTLAH